MYQIELKVFNSINLIFARKDLIIFIFADQLK